MNNNKPICRVESVVKRELARRLRHKMTPAETILWNNLRARRCAGHNFRRQQVLIGYVVDFYCHAKRLAIELDGPIHEAQQAADIERTNALANAGFHVIRFNNHEVFESLANVLSTIIAKLNADPVDSSEGQL